jgi:hypothetical protein
MFLKGQKANTLGSAAMGSVITTQGFHGSVKTSLDNIQRTGVNLF